MQENKEQNEPINRPKNVDEILNEQIDASLHEHKRSNFGLLISSLGGGLEVGFSIFLMGIVTTLFHHEVSDNSLHVMLAFCYSIGFIFVIIGRSELFTEHTALAILPVFNRSATIRSLFEIWGIVYVGNLVGGYLFSYLMTTIGPSIGIINDESFIYLANKMIHHDWGAIVLSGVLAGWLMGLLGWLVTSSQETISRILIIILVTATIGMGGLHHCIVGSIEVFSGFLVSDEVGWSDYLKFQSAATLGNIIGGVVFVALLKFSHIRVDSDS